MVNHELSMFSHHLKIEHASASFYAVLTEYVPYIFHSKNIAPYVNRLYSKSHDFILPPCKILFQSRPFLMMNQLDLISAIRPYFHALKKLDKDTEKTDRAKVLFKLQSV